MKILYLGLNPPRGEHIVHFPLIRIIPKELSIEYEDLKSYTHILFTSQSAVKIFFSYIDGFNFDLPLFIAVGKKTKSCIESFMGQVVLTADEESAEGLIEALNNFSLESAYLFWPHSSLSRSLLKNYLIKKGVRHKECILYDTVPFMPGPHPPLDEVEEIVFTSPSTVNAYLTYFGKLPKNKKLTAIGPVTRNALDAFLF